MAEMFTHRKYNFHEEVSRAWTFYTSGNVRIYVNYDVTHEKWKVKNGLICGTNREADPDLESWVPFGDEIQQAYKNYIAKVMLDE